MSKEPSPWRVISFSLSKLADSSCYTSVEPEKEDGVNDCEEDDGGQEEGGPGDVDVKTVQTGKKDSVNTGRSTGSNQNCTQHYRIGKKLAGYEVAGHWGDEKFHRQNIQDAAIVVFHFRELDGITHRQKRSPS